MPEAKPKRTWWQRFKATTAHNQASIVFSALIMAATIAYSIIAVIQLHVMWKASEDSGKQTQKLIEAANINANAAKEIAAASKRNAKAAESFSTSADNISVQMGKAVEKLKIQAEAADVAANAAVSAANTAKDTLHVSERAYVDIVAPMLDAAKQTIYLPITNTGRIPSGVAEIVIHEATFNVRDGTTHADISNVVEKSWKRTVLQSVAPGNPIKIVVPLPASSLGRLINSQQIIMVAGYISINDGFADTSPQKGEFCWRSINLILIKEINLTPCDPKVALPIMEKMDNYPNDESPY